MTAFRRRSTRLFILAAAASLFGAGTAQGQVVTSEIRGRVVDQDGKPLVGAQVSVTDARTNITTGAVTNAVGRYFVSQLQPGGPYTVTAQFIGFRSVSIVNINISLSHAETVNLTLQQTAVEVEPITVTVTAPNAVFSKQKTGQSTLIDPTELETFPTIQRNVMELTLLSPYANQFENAPSIAGKANRLNNIQIDGAVNNDVFGVGETGTPGGASNAKAIPLEALQEIQILVAPFDVRHSNFGGGLINAVTKSGTNEWQFSTFGQWTGCDSKLIVGDACFISSIQGRDFGTFANQQFGWTAGGPIVKDKVFFFGAAEGQRVQQPREGFQLGVANQLTQDIGLDPAEAQQAADIFQNNFGVNPGSTSPTSAANPRTNIFARVDIQLNKNNRLMLRHNYARGNNVVTGSRSSSRYTFDSNFNSRLSNTHSSVAQLFSKFGSRWDNEALVNVEFIRDVRNPLSNFGQVTVETSGPDFRFGAERFSQANRLDQDIFQFTDNLTGRFGNHRLTFGTHNEYYNFLNLFEPGILGLWDFDSLADLQANSPSFYLKRVPAAGLSESDLPAQFQAFQLGFYGQDEWTVTDKLTLTGGLRVEIPILPDNPRRNDTFVDAFGIDNSKVASGKPLWQPRVGVNYTMGTEYLTQLRGGIGLFAGRSPFVWISNAYGNTGIQSVDLVCFGSNAPGFTSDAPSTCRDGTGAGAASQPVINVIDPDFKFPLDLKISAGIDRQLPKGFSVTGEILYTQAIEEVFFEELNLVGISGTDPVEGGRPFFGTPTASGCGNRGGCFTNNLKDDRFRNVVNLTNRSDSHALLTTFGLQREFSDWLRFRFSYTYADVQDVQVQQSSQATSNFGRNAITGDPNHPEVLTSAYEVENKVVVGATGRWRFGRGWKLEITPTYFGQTGSPFSYVVRGDPNGDNFRNSVISRDNDAIYIPNNVSELAFKTPEDAQNFDALINANECLRKQRGQLMRRNSCRNPWNDSFNFQAVLGIPAGPKGQFEFTVNVLNLGESLFERSRIDRGIEALRVTGRENGADNGRFVYQYRGPRADSNGNIDPAFTVSPQSNRQLQLGIRYRFN